MKNYFVVAKRTLSDLEKDVNSFMEMGWVPIGGFFTTENSWYYQPMVKK